ncbi:S8 family serine peptidase [Bacillus sp. 165]|uniref:S8 family serine peptidase n=1 Tax=Bacillus sp. 165 TaxID=1529117 RepID=UPI001ADC069D|nr:S8 family serine peptidase [Bacillus sp. 165]MBO9128922.1 S8 family serine peptidase [Bacillus sp. 165]
MSKSRRSVTKQATVVALSAGLLIGPAANINYTSIAHAQTNTTAESVLAKLTPEQREALQKLENRELKTGLQLSRDVDLTSNEEVTVIVEFKDFPAKVAQIAKAVKGETLSLTQAKENVEKSHAQFNKDLQSKVGKTKSGKDAYQIKYTYKNSLNGVALTLPANRINTLLDSDVVKAVYSDYKVQLEPPAQAEDAKEQTKVDSIPFLNLDKLHDEGFTGKGIKVGVLDTGVDYNHPDLKHAYKGGYDFVDNDNDPMETTYADWKKSNRQETSNGSTYYTDHGTHVSGTIAGRAENNSDYKVIGVAPEADLYVYRVLGAYGSGLTTAVLAGIDKAVADGMDVINMSLGATTNNPFYVTSLAIDNAVLSGVTAVVAAGNAGNEMYTLGAPGAAALALTVGASSVPSTITTYESQFAAGSGKVSATMQLMTKTWTDDFGGVSGQTYDMVDVGLGGTSDYTGKDVNGKVAFIQRGTYALIEKMKYAKEHGVVGVIIYNLNADEGHIPYFLGESNDNIPTFSMTNKDGLAVKSLFANGVPKVTFGATGKAELLGDELTNFSSRGPSGTLYDIKPEVTAPGVDILSTVPSYIGNKEDTSDYSSAYLRMSGTSMASPHVAGIAALLLQAHPEYTPGDVKSVLMNTADPLKSPYSVFEVGAGRVDPMQAIHSDMIISVQDETPYIENGEEKMIAEQTGGISYGFVPMEADKNYTKTTKLSFANSGKENKKYELSVEYNVGARGSLDAKKNGVTVQVPNTLKVKKNSTEQLTAFLVIPKTAQKGIYEGYINIQEKNNPEESYRIPFGVKVVEEGLGYFDVYTKSISTNRIVNPFSRKGTDLDFILNSPMETLDWILVDPKTNKDLGLIATVDATVAAVDTYYYIEDLFYGRYYPFTGNAKKPIGYVSELAPDGIYDIKMIGTNPAGKQFVRTSKVSIDNTGPKIIFDNTNAMPKGDLPFVELAEGQDTVTVSGTLLDSEISQTQAVGIPLSQANNKVFYGTNGPSYYTNVDKNGKFSQEIKLTSSSSISSIQYAGADFAGNTALPKIVYYTKPGASYVYAKPNKDAIEFGDKITYTFYAHNLRQANTLSLNMYYQSKYVDSVELKKGQGLPEGSELTTTTTGTISLATTVNISVPGKGVAGDVALFDIEVDTNANEFLNVYSQIFTPTTMQVNNESGNRVSTIMGVMPMYPIYSKATAKLNGVGLYTASGSFNYSMDYTKVGAAMKLQDANGILYDGVIAKDGNVTFAGLPAAVQKYTVIMDIPGHYTTYTPMEIGRMENGIDIGEWITYPTVGAKPGDINKDNTIDILDAILLQNNWGTNNRATDINFDGTTDAKDFSLLEKYYLTENSFVLDTPTPQTEKNGKTIESIKKELGLSA